MFLRYWLVIQMILCTIRAQYNQFNFEDDGGGGHQSTPAPPEVKHKITPLDAMIDKTNFLGSRLLYLHSKSNKNNIAFSPCGVASVLVALYEGANGQSAAEIHDNLVLPFDKDVLRVGYRDIHRRLRSYFYRKENLLSGLSLSSENITIRPEYESILRFYGYDLDTIPEMKMQTTPASTEQTDDYEEDSDMPSTTEMFTTTEDSSGTEERTTEMSSVETTTEIKDIESTTITETTQSNESDVTTEEPTTTEEIVDTTTEETSDETEAPEVEEATEEATEDPEADAGDIEEGSVEARRRNLKFKRGQHQNQRRPTYGYRRRTIRTKRTPEEFDIIGHQKFLQTFLLQDTTSTPPPFAAFPEFSNERSNERSQYQQDRQADDTIEHNFYLNNHETVKVPYKIYNTILKYAYVSRIQSTVLELELDSDYYKLIIVLPDYEFGLTNLMKLLQTDDNLPTLRDIIKQMSSSWVKTIVPKFTLKGNIILTNDLQNMGINDIFEPTRADFTPMTDDPMIYAKHIEQSININIRTQSLQQLKRFTSLYKNPIEMAINYPFLFYILDKELDLALITGRILNPLNSRIH